MPFPLIGALVGGAASLIGAGIQARASRQAAELQAQTQRENLQYTKDQTQAGLGEFDQALQDALGALQTGGTQAGQYQQPYYDAGTGALTAYSNALGLNGQAANDNALTQFMASPGYQWQMQQGVNALDRSAAARGGLYSGAQGKALTEYGQGLANQEWYNYLTNLSGLAGAGQAAGNNLSQIASNQYGSTANALLGTAANKSNLRTGNVANVMDANTNLGLAQASGIINASNAWGNGLTNLTSLIGYAGGQGISAPGLQNVDASRYPNLAQFATRFAA